VVTITDNWLFISSKKDISTKLIKSFWERLSMFLAINIGDCPRTVFTSSKNIWKKFNGEHGRAFYNDSKNCLIFWLPKYSIDKGLLKERKYESILNNLENIYSYAIPISDIYHEMIHHVQFLLGDWLYNDLLESSAEHSTFLITGQDIGDYIEERVSLWYIGRKLLKLKPWQFYIFIRDCVVDPDFYKDYFYENGKFIKILADEYGGSVEKLFMTMKQKLGKKRWYKQMTRDLNKIHNQLFYRW